MRVNQRVNMKHLFVLLFLPFISTQQHGGGYEPRTIHVDREWMIPESTQLGSVVKIVGVDGGDKGDIKFELDRIFNPFNTDNDEIPFWINPTTGYVYLNKSLEGLSKQPPFYVTIGANDGQLTVKSEVRVTVVGKDGKTRTNTFIPNNSHLPPLPNFGSLPPINHGNNGFFIPSSVTRSPTSASTTKSANETQTKQSKTYIDSPTTATTTKIPVETTTVLPPVTILSTERNSFIESPTVIPILIVIMCIFLVAALIAIVIFRKQICRKLSIGKKFSKSKVDKAKNSNQSVSVITVSDDSRNSMVLHNWQGPIAYNNRYTPWSHDGAVYSSSSFSYVSGEAKVPGYDRWEFPRHRLKFFNILGEGAFGQVWRCEGTDIDGIDGVATVAVKTLKENATESEKKDLFSELQVMKSLEPHVNVVRLIGCCTEKDPVFVIIEFVSLGKLQTFLRNSRMEKNYNNSSNNGKSKTLTSHDLVSFMYQVARGMEFLSSRGIIHRDLAARNILITDDYTCKIADFGFARDIETSTVYERKTGGRQPIRWMAIESLYDNIFSVKSDVWSFGILMWEIATLGATPYPGMGAADVMKKIREGYRLEKPEHTSREIYNFMYYCWDSDPKLRPDFGEIRQNLDKLLATSTDYIELERYPEHDYYNIIQNISGEKL